VIGGKALAGVALATLAAGCALIPEELAPPIAPADPLPASPVDPQAVEPVVMLANAVGPAGPYRVWLYRNDEGFVCYEVALPGDRSNGCGQTASDAIAREYAGTVQRGMLVLGATSDPAAAAATVTLVDGSLLTTSLTDGTPMFDAGARYYILPLGLGDAPVRGDIVDATGDSLESFTY
jgi:hypothetical protein